MESAARRETMEEAGVRGTLEVSQDPSYRGRGRVAPLDLLYPSKESVDPPGVVEAPAIDVPHIPAPSMRPCSPLPLGTHHRAQPLPIQEPGLGLYVPPLCQPERCSPSPPPHSGARAGLVPLLWQQEHRPTDAAHRPHVCDASGGGAGGVAGVRAATSMGEHGRARWESGNEHG